MSPAPSPAVPNARASSAARKTRWHSLTPQKRNAAIGALVGLAIFLGFHQHSQQHDISTATGDNLAEAVLDKLPCTGIDRIDATPKRYYCNMEGGSVLVLSCPSTDDAIRDAVMLDDAGWYVDRGAADRRVVLASQSQSNFEVAEHRVAA